ncbi:MAG: hypothetical protein CL555_13380 [Algoriphagus sp.]|nr:hypothetical protein [Algoriphagus sp.]
MRIIQLIDTLEMGGAERMAVNISNALHQDGNEVLVIVSRKKGPLSKFLLERIPLINLEKTRFFDFRAFYQLYKETKDFNPAFIHAHGTSIYWAIILSWFFSSTKLIWHDHLGVNEEVIKNNPRKELKVLKRWIDGIIAVNPVIQDWWISFLNFNPEKIKYIRNFPFLSFSLSSKSGKSLDIVHVANFRQEKGHLTLLDSCKILKSQQVKINLRLIGQILEAEVYEKVLKTIKTYKLEDEVEVVGPVDNIASELEKATNGLVCSDREGLPVSLLEYGLANLQVLSTRVGNCPEVLNNGEFGYLVEPASPDQLASMLIYMRDHQVEAKEKSNKFHNHVSSNYGAKQFLKEYYSFLKVVNPHTLIPASF